MESQKPITDLEFQNALIKILAEYTPGMLLSVPGIYEILSEEFNNDAIDLVYELRETG